jgi:alpha-N-arabinofuranosidase
VAQDVPYLDVAAVLQADGKSIAFFVVNRSLDAAIDLSVALQGFKDISILQHQMMTGDDLKLRNDAEAQTRIRPVSGSGLQVNEGTLAGKLAPKSYHFILVSVSDA